MWRKVFVICLLSFLFLPGFSSQAHATIPFFQGTQKANPEIDAKLKEADAVYKKENFKAAFPLYKEIYEIAKRENYSKGIVEALLGMSGSCYNLGNLEDSTTYLIEAREEDYAKDNPEILYSINFREGTNLHAIGLYEEAIKKYKKALQLTSKIQDQNSKIDKIFGVYVNIGDIYQMENKKDSALYYYKSAYNSPTTNLWNKFISSVSISEIHSDKKELDSSKVYLAYAKHYSSKIKSKLSESLLSEMTAKYQIAEGNYDSAIISLKKSLTINQNLKRNHPKILKLLSDVYQKTGEEDLSNDFLKKYVAITDSLQILNQKNLKVPVILAKTDTEKQIGKVESNTKTIVFISVLSLIIVSFSAYYIIKKQKRKGLRGKKENQQLKKKLNNAFDEVVELAQNNSPNFLSRFIEVYPEFYNHLITEYPDLTTADVRLCFLIKLDFSTKEIAEMTFSSLRTVQNRMYKLRKKFNLSTDDKLNRFIQTLQLENTH